MSKRSKVALFSADEHSHTINHLSHLTGEFQSHWATKIINQLVQFMHSSLESIPKPFDSSIELTSDCRTHQGLTICSFWPLNSQRRSGEHFEKTISVFILAPSLIRSRLPNSSLDNHNSIFVKDAHEQSSIVQVIPR